LHKNQNPCYIQKIQSLATVITLSPIHSIAKNNIIKNFHAANRRRFQFGISEGCFSKHIDDFFLAVGIDIYVGLGLTETSPVVAVRVEERIKPIATDRFTYDEFFIADPETYKPVKKGEKGVVLIKGPQVMKGYYKDEENSKKVLLPSGYFVSGDIGWMTDDDTLVLTGRAKDIIVLSNGENIEPDAIEQSCMTSPFVKQIVLAGQDKNALSALVVPNMEAIHELAEKKNINSSNPLKSPELKNEILKELRKRVENRETFRNHERLSNIEFVEEGFTPENGLMTLTAKIKKNEVYEKYRQTIESMYN
jgi:long-chain acyl-CoA synthetase